MQAKISINMNNAAFQPQPQVELRRILLQVCDCLGDYPDGIDQISLLDINGNSVGKLEVLEGNNGTPLYQDPEFQPNSW